MGRTGRQQAAAVIAVLGPRTTLVVALPGATPRCVQLTRHGEEWKVRVCVCVFQHLRMKGERLSEWDDSLPNLFVTFLSD